MAIVTCKECGGELSSKAKRCPKCGAVRKRHGCLMVLGVFLALGFLVAVVGGISNTPQKTGAKVAEKVVRWQDRDNSPMAIVQAKEFVRARLKAPSTAEFPGMFEQKQVERLPNHHYAVVSWVDAQNGFGAMIRTRYKADVMQIDEYRWILLRLKMPY